MPVGVLAVVLASSASAAEWRSMRIDASSESSYTASVAALKEELPRVRRAVFEQSLVDIRVAGTQAAAADEREYTQSDYLRDVDGLGYKEVVTLTDPTGDTADRYWDQAYAALLGRRAGRSQQSPFDRRAGYSPGYSPPREAGESSFRPLGGEPGINPWQR